MTIALEAAQAAEGQRAPALLMPLVRELCDLKRVRSAGRSGSIAERMFADAWAQLACGADPETVMRATLARALAATRLGDLDIATLAGVGVPAAEARAILRRGTAEAAAPLDAGWQDTLADAWTTASGPASRTEAGAPGFVMRLAEQPRAGATCPGRGRLVLEPPESHADHCALVALIGALMAPAWGADSTTVFVAALAHHLHNALLPDAGFAGEVMLGEWLEPAMARATELALNELPANPRALVVAARRILPDAATPEGRAFHAADTLDRVLQVEHHLRAAGTTMRFVLREMELVHAGPVRPFQQAVLARMGLAA